MRGGQRAGLCFSFRLSLAAPRVRFIVLADYRPDLALGTGRNVFSTAKTGRGGSNPSGISKRDFEDCQALANEKILLFEPSDCVGAVGGNHINDGQLLEPNKPL